MRASGRIVFVRENIRCDIHLYAVVMGKFDALHDLFVRKVFRLGAEAECLTAEIYSISAVDNGCL